MLSGIKNPILTPMTIAQRFNTSGFSRFVNSGPGRVLRLGAGITFVTVGLLLLPNPLGFAALAWSPVPLSAGLFDVCWISAILGGPVRSSQIRDFQTAHLGC